MFDITIIIASLLLSFFFSGTETAFVSVNNVFIEVWRREKPRKRFISILLPFLKEPEKFLYTTLIGNNISNVAFGTFATIFLNQYFSSYTTIAIITAITLLLGEILPKTIFHSLANDLIKIIVYPLRFFQSAFYLPTIFISKISEFMLSLLGHRKEELKTFFSSTDVEILLNQSKSAVSENAPVEGEYVSGVLNLKELWVRDAMLPRTEIIAVPESDTIEAIKKVFKKHGHTKVPVFRDTLDNIIGIVFLKELFLEPASFAEMIQPVTFVPETKRCSDLLREFQETNTSIAIVIDEYGGTAGLITTEDLVEELFGEIEDEDDEQEVMIRQIDEKTYRVNARIEIDKLNEILDDEYIPEGDYETLAGFILGHLGYIPRREEQIDYNEIVMTVTSATRRKIQWVKITLPSA